MHSRILVTNIINTFVYSVKQLLMLFQVPKYNYVFLIFIVTMSKFFLFKILFLSFNTFIENKTCMYVCM